MANLASAGESWISASSAVLMLPATTGIYWRTRAGALRKSSPPRTKRLKTNKNEGLLPSSTNEPVI